MSTFYLPRQLYEQDNKERLIKQHELLTAEHKLIIVLAEPGAGKTCLLDALANQAGVQRYTANFFVHNKDINKTNILIIDGFDEWAKNQKYDIYELLAKIQDFQPEKIILSSRSGEWLAQHTQACQEMLGQPAKIFYLSAFSETEQEKIFQHLHAEHDFKQFLQAAKRIELSPLLGNPLFFKLFADAYAEQNGQFITKRAAFESAMNYLAREENRIYTFSKQKKLALIENVFAKLLLSGSEGVALSDTAETKLFPHIETIVDNPDIRQILHTRFFQTADETERHRPIHRIVVEYCAAKNLLERMNQENQKNEPLRLTQCLSVIAPNGVVREDLRGLVGWLAALSENREIQERLIELDPYAVIANGEPSLLLPTSKRKLLSKLQQLNDENPYFRGSDRWRSFSVTGFFNEDTVEEVCHLLSEQGKGDLRSLLLELLVGAPILPALAQPLQDIVRYTDDKRKDWYVRTLAGELLCKIPDYPHKDEWQFLLEAGDNQSLKIAAMMMASFPNIFQLTDFEQLLRQCAKLYPADKYGLHRVIGERYFIRQFIKILPLPTVEFLLNQLSADLSCTCNKEIYDCDCRHGISNIISMLLDNFFELTSEPYNPEQIWAWLKNLHFLHEHPSSKTRSMQILQDNIALRQGILRLAFERATDRKTIHQITYYQFDWYAHAGLRLQSQDYWYLVNLAFETDNVELWRYFRQIHVYNKENENKENLLRRHMRKQAMQKLDFLKAWYQGEKYSKEYNYENLKYKKKTKRRRAKEKKIIKRTIQYIHANREKIASGKDWQFLSNSACYRLEFSNNFIAEIDDELVSTELYNCIDFIEPHLPSFAELSRLEGKSPHSIPNVVMILCAHSLEVFKRYGSLASLSKDKLWLLRINSSLVCNLIDEQLYKQEIDQLIFNNNQEIEWFLRQFIESQLATSECDSPKIYILDEEIFKPFQKTLPLEWLQRFDDMPEYAYTELFKQVALHGDLVQLKTLIAQKCSALAKQYPYKTDNVELEQKREFWYLQAFYFLDSGYESYWDWLQQDNGLIFKIDNDIRRSTKNNYIISSEKIEYMFNTFIDKWEKEDLPNAHSSSSPREKKLYPFLCNLIYKIADSCNGNPIPVLKRLLANEEYLDFYPTLKSQLFHYIQQQKIKNIAVPTMKETVDLLDNEQQVISVEHMRALILEELAAYQADLNGNEFTSKDSFYDGGKRVGENRATQIVGERLRLKLERYGIDCHLEHLMSDNKRCDFTCSKRIHDRQRLLVVEAKGQWHKELYSAIENQLVRQYTIHPNAEKQGIFLVYWFGTQEKLAGLKNTMSSAEELQRDIVSKMPVELQGLIDVFVLDVSRVNCQTES